jgi:hypothetical protein
MMPAEASMADPDLCSSWTELAKRQGVSRAAVYKWRKHPSWPSAFEAMPVSSAAVTRWRASDLQEDRARTADSTPQPQTGNDPEVVDATHQIGDHPAHASNGAQPQAGSSPSSMHQRIQQQIRMEDLLGKRLKRQILEGQYISRDHHTRAFVALIRDLLLDLDELWKSVPEITVGTGMDQKAFADFMRQWVADLRAKYASEEYRRLASDPELIEAGLSPETEGKRPDRPGRPPATTN